jgi:hypothetical protein
MLCVHLKSLSLYLFTLKILGDSSYGMSRITRRTENVLQVGNCYVHPRNKEGWVYLNSGHRIEFYYWIIYTSSIIIRIPWSSYSNDHVPHVAIPKGSFWWRDYFSLSYIYIGFTSCSVNNGKSILFWKDNLDDSIREDDYPRLFSFANDRKLSQKRHRMQQTMTFMKCSNSLLSTIAYEQLHDVQDEIQSLNINKAHDRWNFGGGNYFST